MAALSVMLTFVTRTGIERKIRLKNNVTEIDLSNQGIESIDLSPLSSCKDLRKLILKNNSLKSIDLSPLSSCSSLNLLDLGNNQMRSVDLSPLRNCTQLETLYIYWNYLKQETVIPRFGESIQEESVQREGPSIDGTSIVLVDSTAAERIITFSTWHIDF